MEGKSFRCVFLFWPLLSDDQENSLAFAGFSCPSRFVFIILSRAQSCRHHLSSFRRCYRCPEAKTGLEIVRREIGALGDWLKLARRWHSRFARPG